MLHNHQAHCWGPIAERVELAPLAAADWDKRLRAVMSYWESLRGDRPMPTRADLRPEQMREALGRLMLIEVQHAPRVLTYRLFGTTIADRMGFDLTGRTVEDMRPEWYRDKIRQDFDRVIDTGEPAASLVSVERSRRLFTYQRLVLPLGGADGRVGMLLVASFTMTDGDPLLARA